MTTSTKEIIDKQKSHTPRRMWLDCPADSNPKRGLSVIRGQKEKNHHACFQCGSRVAVILPNIYMLSTYTFEYTFLSIRNS